MSVGRRVTCCRKAESPECNELRESFLAPAHEKNFGNTIGTLPSGEAGLLGQ